MDSKKIIDQILTLKQELGNRIVIPAHHYQIPEIVAVADFVGDSYKLAVDCSNSTAEVIIFCGVYFMAEAADILSDDNQIVIMPTTAARCPMADQIGIEQAQKAYHKIAQKTKKKIAPVVYMNSNAEVKSFSGSLGGSVCTSSNAAAVVRHYLKQDQAVFFSPDFNLGINTARQLNLAEEEIIKITQDFEIQGNPTKGKIFIWDGFCYVHKRFILNDIRELRQQNPGVRIIVHPECDEEIVQSADDAGSTARIYNEIKKSPASSVWGVGTEYHFVKRIAEEFADKTVLPLRKSVCGNMAKNTLSNLLESLLSVRSYYLRKTRLNGIVSVAEATKSNAAIALKKMIEIVEN
jgi:quinolinate synthase